MSLVKIVGLIIAIPAILIITINWWVEGQVANAVLEAFGVHPIIIALISIIGLIVLIKIILNIIS